MSASAASVAVVASGMVTPLGYNAASSLAALRAGISAVQRLPWVDEDKGEPLRGARVHLPQWWSGTGMLADLLAPAVWECLQHAGEPVTRVPLLVGVSARGRPGRPEDLEEALLPALQARLGGELNRGSALLPLDQFGPAKALAIAAAWLRQGTYRSIIVAGVDSRLSTDSLSALMAQRRLLTATNINGMLPSEAACAVLLTRAGASADELVIEGLGQAHETAVIESDQPLQGHALTQAYRQALKQAGCTYKDIDYRLTDLSGEHYKFKEAHFALARLDTQPRARQQELWHPIEYLGDIGAAILPCLLAQAQHASKYGYAPGKRALCHVGSDSGERAAIVVRATRIGTEGA